MSSIRRAVFLSLAQRYVAFAIQFVWAMIMARLLTPAETGVFSLAASIVAIGHLMRDFGVGEYIVQERELSHERLRAAFSVTIFVAWGLALVMFVLAQPLAALYREPAVARVLYVLIPSFLLIPVGTSAFALLTREMQFGAIFWIQTSSALVGAVVGILLAWHGFSYMSMAWSSLANVLVTIAFLGVLRPRETFMLPSFRGLARVGKFGGSLTLGRLGDSIAMRAPDFVIGRLLSFADVGIFSKATTLLNAFQDFFSSALGRVATPAFASRKGNIPETRDGYLRATGLFVVFPIGFYGFCALFAEPIIMLMFGANWLAAAPIIQVASIGYLVMSPHTFAYPVLTANGKIRHILKIQLTCSLIYVPALVAGAHFNLVACAIAGALVTLPRLWLTQNALSRCFGLNLGKILQTVTPGAGIACAGLVAAAPSLLLYAGTTRSALETIIAAALSAGIVGLVALFLSRHPLADELARLAVFRRWLPRNRT